MKWLRQIRRRLEVLIHRERFDEDVAEEMQSHLEMQAEEEGPEARRRFGNLTLLREQSREVWGWRLLEVAVQDSRYAFRQLLRSPGFTAVAVLCLAVGIGATSTALSLADGMWMRPLPVNNPGDLVYLFLATDSSAFGGLSYPEYEDFRDQAETLAGLTITQRRGPVLTGDGFAESTMSNVVSEDYFTVLGVRAQLGRVFTAGDRDSGPVVVMSDSLWRRRFGADPGIVGRPVRLGRIYTVIGIAPRGFRGIEQWTDSDFWIPMSSWDPSETGERAQRGSHSFAALGRLRQGVSIKQARAEIQGIARNLERAYPQFNRGRRGVLYSALEYRLRDAGDMGGILLGVVAVVLLIACANVANLLLARAGVRSREIGLRMAIGAGRFRLVRQLLTESVIIAALGAAAGLLLARWLITFLPSLVTAPGDDYFHYVFRMDGRVLVPTLALSLLTVLVFGLFPALRTSAFDVASVVKGSDQFGPGRSRPRGRLVVAQVALSMILLTAAGLLVRTFIYSMRSNLGFERKNVLVANVMPSGGLTRRRESYRQLLERVRAMPNVRQATLAMRPPLWGSEGGTAQRIEVPGRPVAPGETAPPVKYNIVGPNYFRTLGIPLLRGRGFNEHDGPEAPKVMVVSETMARRFWPNQDAVGKYVHAGDEPVSVSCQVVGVVGDVRINSFREAPEPYFYMPYSQSNRGSIMLLAETAGDPLRLVSQLRAVVATVDKRAPVLHISTLGLVIRSNVYDQQLAASVVSSLGVIALILAAIGLYGIISYTMVQRTREIGIRMAIGAQRRDALRLVLSQGVRLAAIGIAAGFAGALAVAPLLGKMLYGVSSRDPVTLACAAALMMSVALAASYLPARRAAKIDPVEALRCE